jgi:phage terminase large subunit
LRIVDYIEDSHRSLPDYVADLEGRPYRYGQDWLPHDGAAKSIQTGLSAQEVLQKLGRQVRITPDIGVEQGIKAARLAFPRVYFDKDKAIRLVDCLKRYRRAINATTNEPGPPLHDAYSHGADAFRYLAVVADKLTNDDYLKMKPINYPSLGIR